MGGDRGRLVKVSLGGSLKRLAVEGPPLPPGPPPHWGMGGRVPRNLGSCDQASPTLIPTHRRGALFFAKERFRERSVQPGHPGSLPGKPPALESPRRPLYPWPLTRVDPSSPPSSPPHHRGEVLGVRPASFRRSCPTRGAGSLGATFSSWPLLRGLSGIPGGTRTPNHRFWKPALYRLSYGYTRAGGGKAYPRSSFPLKAPGEPVGRFSLRYQQQVAFV